MQKIKSAFGILFVIFISICAGCSADTPGNEMITYTTVASLPETVQTDYTEISFMGENLLPDCDSVFDSVKDSSGTNWLAFGGGKALIDRIPERGSCFAVTGRENEWTTPALDLFPYIRSNGAGLYTVSFTLAFDGDIKKGQVIHFGTLIRSDGEEDENSFIADYSSNYYGRLDNASVTFEPRKWFDIERTIYIEENDLEGSHSWKLCLDMLSTDVKTIYLGHCYLIKETIDMVTEQYTPQKVQAWTASEIILISEKQIEDPFNDITLDAVFTSGETKLVVPAFWDGGNVWRVRFMLPREGSWNFTTVSSDPSDTSMHGISGKIDCVPYTGNLEIYRHGFLKTEKDVRYFMYNDGTPFFYLGDTHWNMPAEEFSKAGDHAGKIQTDSHFKYIVDTRVKQKFTVYQSEPIGASYRLSDGFSEADIYGFRLLDEKFQYIAASGFVHANAALFFVSELANFPDKFPDDYLEKLTRYWVARYCAYPVLWTLAQECDNDFYFDRGDQKTFDAETNPWKKVCVYIHKYDPYASPMTAHQEYASMDAVHGVNASRSSFKDLEGHTWFAAQWSPSLASRLDFGIARDFYYNGQGKPVVNYEGRYDYLWTKHFGARVQGWTAFLNGMFGYGYGAIDIWLYKSTYNIDVSSEDGVQKITPEDKAVHWSESVHFETADQMGYMRTFFENINWQKLIPRFDDKDWIEPDRDTCWTLASDGSDLYVCYFYNRSQSTAVLKGLQNSEYQLQWYDPRNNSYTDPVVVTPDNGSFDPGKKTDHEDWVLILAVKN